MSLDFIDEPFSELQICTDGDSLYINKLFAGKGSVRRQKDQY